MKRKTFTPHARYTLTAHSSNGLQETFNGLNETVLARNDLLDFTRVGHTLISI